MCQRVLCNPSSRLELLLYSPKSFSKLVTLLLNLNTKSNSGSARNEVVVSEAVGIVVGVACYGRRLKKGGGGRIVVVKTDVISGTAIIGTVVSIKESISLSAREGFSRFRSLLVNSEETEELYTGSSVFCVLRSGVSVT
ncbi:hypothetical protein Tco_0594211 [Tanacetum coccineum]